MDKRKAKKFNREFKKQILELGARLLEDTYTKEIFETFKLETDVGMLVINLPLEQTVCYTVFSRFMDVEQAKVKYNCNPHSGKYNVHIGTDIELEQAIEHAIMKFEGMEPTNDAIRVNIKDFYPDANYTPYFEGNVPLESKPDRAKLEVGMLMYDKENNAIGMILGCIDETYHGEVRLDSDGMQPISNLRLAKMSDLNNDGIKFAKDLKEYLEKSN